MSEPQAGWSKTFEHGNSERINELLAVLQSNLNGQQKLANVSSLLYYLRSFYYFADNPELTEQQTGQLHSLLLQLTDNAEFFSTNESALRLQENYLVSIYLFFSDKKYHPMISQHRNNIARILRQLTKTETTQLTTQAEYTLWETLRSIAFLSYEARRSQSMKEALLKEDSLVNALTELLEIQSRKDWVLQHTLWSAGYLHRISSKESQEKLDSAVQKFLSTADFLSEQDKSFYFSRRYLVNSFRVQDDCQESFSEFCSIPKIDTALPIKHECSPSLFIRANQMSGEELSLTCQKLTSQEDSFHQLLATDRLPADDDFNDSLRVVIFDNYSQYNEYGALTFNIHTDNGGMYIEGNPWEKNNQATFFSFEMFWERPDFGVWNLNHEYVHYLDGRFVKYGAFGHFPEKLVWWSEGLAEYISKGKDNPRALKLLSETPQAEWPTLETEFATTYQDGLDRTYRWSYLVIRFLAENDISNFRSLALALKNNDFESYLSLLNQIATRHQQEYSMWLQTLKADSHSQNGEEEKVVSVKPRKLYRYLYRDYLMPKGFEQSPRHMHFH
ncbi:collagenase [Aliikangiella sp. G2MR2-5]|uniref:collagenase n=1 Tax=Aliikangiella sp. G2MR2-5 TaxID=2788943 RepID=UPI0018AAE54E|nr:collagenase [Aliikangiella sp. G2MR2-5]